MKLVRTASMFTLTVIVLVTVMIMLVPMMIDDNGHAYDNDGAGDGL